VKYKIEAINKRHEWSLLNNRLSSKNKAIATVTGKERKKETKGKMNHRKQQ